MGEKSAMCANMCKSEKFNMRKYAKNAQHTHMPHVVGQNAQKGSKMVEIALEPNVPSKKKYLLNYLHTSTIFPSIMVGANSKEPSSHH